MLLLRDEVDRCVMLQRSSSTVLCNRHGVEPQRVKQEGFSCSVKK